MLLKFKNFHKKAPDILKLVFLFALVGVLFLPHQAQAINILNMATDAIGWTMAKIGYSIGYSLGIVVRLEAVLIAWVLTPNAFAYTKAPAVALGWEITRNIVNLGLVIALVFIAIATILRLQTYSMKQTLLRLIAAAILINFSLVIAGLFIDTANLITGFFVIHSVEGGPDGYSRMFANGFDVIGLLQRSSVQQAGGADAVYQLGRGFLQALVGVLFFVVFSVIMVIVLGAIFVMLLIRIIWLWGLLIAAPFAWLFWIFPKPPTGVPSLLSWQGWWQNFLRWTFFAPIVSFFLYVAFQMINELAKQKSNAGFLATLPQTSGITLLQSSSQTWLLQFILFAGFLIMGLIAANEMGITGANIAFNYAKGAATGISKWPLKMSQQAGSYVGQKALTGEGWVGDRARKMQEWAAGRPVVGGISDYVGKVRSNYETRIEDAGKRYKNMSTKTLKDMLKDRRLRSLPDQLALMDILSEKGKLGEVGKDSVETRKILSELYKTARNYGRGGKIENVIPTLSDNPTKAVKENPKPETILADEYNSDQVVEGLSPAKVRRLLAESEDVNQLNNALQKLKQLSNRLQGTDRGRRLESLVNILTLNKNVRVQYGYNPTTGKFTA